VELSERGHEVGTSNAIKGIELGMAVKPHPFALEPRSEEELGGQRLRWEGDWALWVIGFTKVSPWVPETFGLVYY